MTSEKIVIVGAGLSGYSAAAKLMENGINDIIILEAEYKTGGRINSSAIDDNESKFIDLGAQWVHGQQENSIYEMIDGKFSFGSSTKFEELDLSYLSSSGNLADISTKDLNVLLNLLEKITSAYKTMRFYDGSFGDFVITEYRKKMNEPKYATISEETKQQALDFAEKATLATEAAPSWLDVSAKLTASGGEAEGDQYLTWRTEGFRTVFDFITVSCSRYFTKQLRLLSFLT